MKAALLEEFGRPLIIGEIPDPEPGPGQIVVRVEACGLCHSDLHLARGEWEAFKPRMPVPAILGHEISGHVARIGPGTSRFQEGDRVGVPWFHWTCGSCDYCRRDLEVFCDRSEITGVTVHGGFAEYVVAWESHTIPIPATVPSDEAAPLFCAGGTVWSALLKLQLDNSVHLGIWGAGGLGQYAIQLAKIAGARVTAVDLVSARLERARQMGADVAVAVEDAREWFRAPENRVDAALVCATSTVAYEDAFRALRKNGVLLVVGLPSKPLSWTAADLIRSGTRIVPSRVASRREIADLLALSGEGKIRSEVQRFPLEEINTAIAALERGKISSRAVIYP